MLTEEHGKREAPSSGSPPWLLPCLQKALGHELPNQLVSAQGLLHLLETEEPEKLGDEARDYLRRVRANLERSQRLVGALAEVVRVLRAEEPGEPVDLPEAVQEAAAECRQAFPGKTISFTYVILEARPTVPPQGFRRALGEILRGAVMVQDGPSPQVEIRAAEAETGVEVRVTAPGRGLTADPEQLVQAPAGAAGAPLGLLVARALAERWGGRLEVVSLPGGGNAFLLGVPRT